MCKYNGSNYMWFDYENTNVMWVCIECDFERDFFLGDLFDLQALFIVFALLCTVTLKMWVHIDIMSQPYGHTW